MKQTIRRQFAAAVLALGAALVLPTAQANDASEAHALADKARITIDMLAHDGNFSAMREGLKHAKGVLIFPQVIKAGYFIGGSGGTGVLLARDGENWTGPAFYTLAGASLGVQFGGEAAEVVILVNSQKALDALYANHFKVGADASVAAGPVGQGKGQDFTTDMTIFSKAKGAFIGVSLDGTMLDVRESLNNGYYGRKVTPVDILVKRSVLSKSSDALREAVKDAAA